MDITPEDMAQVMYSNPLAMAQATVVALKREAEEKDARIAELEAELEQVTAPKQDISEDD